MIAKILATTLLAACTVNTAREIVASNPGSKETSLPRHLIKCATLSILATATITAAAALLNKE